MRATDGSRRRGYDICVNGRPVGVVRLATDVTLAAPGGRVDRLEVAPPHRRRGRGTIAVLAAEEVLRSWGCDRVELRVAPEAVGALRMAAALGYAECGDRRHKRLPSGRALPSAGGRAMGAEEFPAWSAAQRGPLADCWTRAGLAADRAAAHADAALARLPGPRAALRVLEHEGEPAGTAWIRLLADPPDGADACVAAFAVAADHRGHGHGRAILGDAEQHARAAGVRTLGLHLCTGAAPAARHLADSLGYRPVWRHLAKAL